MIESVKQIPKTPPIPPQRPKSIPTLTTEETETCRPWFNTDAGVLFHLNQRKDINPLDAQLALKTFWLLVITFLPHFKVMPSVSP